MNECFCTIVTEDYIPYARSLHQSLQKVSSRNQPMYVLVHTENGHLVNNPDGDEGMFFLDVNELCAGGIASKIKSKYFRSKVDFFRWSMKPVLINFLIKERQFDKVIFLDCDLYFYSDYNFLFDKLDSSNVLLCPHWRSSDPTLDRLNFGLQYNAGLFNGGFVAANKHATAAMEWWAMACEYVCEVDYSKGFFVDQTHLNLLPIFFDKVEILKHRGCNIANWNQLECSRVIGADGKVHINNEYPIVFIHFTGSTIRGILNGEDGLLMPHLKEYAQALKANGCVDDVIAKAEKQLHQKQQRKHSITSKIKGRVKRWLR